MENDIRKAYDLNTCFILPKYPPEEFSESYKDELITELARCTRLAKGFFDDCRMTVEGDEVRIDMKDGYAKLPSAADCEKLISDIIFNEFSKRVNVTLNCESFNLSEYNAKYDYTMLFDSAPTRSGDNGENDIFHTEQRSEGSVIPTSLKDDTVFSFDAEKGLVHAGHTVFDINEPENVYGRKWRTSDLDHFHPLKDLDRDLGPVSFCGCVVSVEESEIRGSDGYRIKIALSDDASSITLKTSGDQDKVGALREKQLDKKTPLLVAGVMRFDQFENEYIVRPQSVSRVRTVRRKDEAPEKLVELHLHTKMSTMDATIEPGEIVRIAHDWGHRAVAITDHG
ncbi:MAG: PHP domain-containing protein, partial [Clostridia bacterium]|nr:PHP domain-containing protein [Clostridia bacterium]